MVKVFISYRRDDSEFVADSIYNELKAHFGEGNVFLDVGEIPFGVDFRTYLRDQIDAHDAALVLIGPKWADIMKARASRQDDFVRIEIESALKLNKLVIPVLVMRQEQMPDFSDLRRASTICSGAIWRKSAANRTSSRIASAWRITSGADCHRSLRCKSHSNARAPSTANVTGTGSRTSPRSRTSKFPICPSVSSRWGAL